MFPSTAIVIRTADAADHAVLNRLAALDSQQPLAGETIIAEIDGRPAAALQLSGGRVVADPFSPTLDVVALLRLRAERLTDRRPRRRVARRHLVPVRV